jgi:hypothetical protein
MRLRGNDWPLLKTYPIGVNVGSRNKRINILRRAIRSLLLQLCCLSIATAQKFLSYIFYRHFAPDGATFLKKFISD